MDDTTLVILREVVIELVKECLDADLLDLLYKLLAEAAVAASNE